MGQASSSSASTAAINSNGSLTVNGSNPILWIVIAVAIVAFVIWRKK
jgi:hypothetical protein